MKQQLLIILLLGVYCPVLIFVGLAISIWQNGGTLAWDAPILLAIHQTVQTKLDILAVIASQLGSYRGIIPITAIVTLVLLSWKQWRQSIYLLAIVLSCFPLSAIVKILLHRARPSLWELSAPLPLDYAFPSGHATASMTLVVALIVLSWGSRWCASISIVGGLFVLTVGWSRLYLGVHFPSDVLAGWMLAIAWGLGTSLLFQLNWKELGAIDPEKPNFL
jgi:membrane-associated phospholipid phosphatase